MNSIFKFSDLNLDDKISKKEFEIYTKHQNEKITYVFNELDINKDNVLSLEELSKAIHRFDPSYDNDQIAKILKRLDRDKSGSISLSEFATYYHLIPIINIKMMFSIFEREGYDIGETISLNGDFVDETKSRK